MSKYKNTEPADMAPVEPEWIERMLRIAYASKGCGNSTTALPTQMAISVLLELQARRVQMDMDAAKQTAPETASMR